MITLNYTYRIYPDRNQQERLNKWFEICRVSYNYALRELKDWITSRKCSMDRCSIEKEYIMRADYPFPGYHQQQNNLPGAKKDFPRLKEVPSQVLQTNIRRLHDAWDFFRHRGYGFPRFKKYGQMNRWHSCPECNYEADRDIAAAQEICNRGLESKDDSANRLFSTQGLWGKEIGYQVGRSGAMCLDTWRRVAIS